MPRWNCSLSNMRVTERGGGQGLSTATPCSSFPTSSAVRTQRNGESAHAPSMRSWTEVLRPAAARVGRPLTVLDLGAGNGWLSYRVALEGHHAFALDIRDDTIDGLGAAECFVARRATDGMRRRVVRCDSTCPRPDRHRAFNASLHYATDLASCSAKPRAWSDPAVRSPSSIRPFYAREADGLAMVAEKNRAPGNSANGAGVAHGAPVYRIPHARADLSEAAPTRLACGTASAIRWTTSCARCVPRLLGQRAPVPL